jgi:uncharacterized membrane protein
LWVSSIIYCVLLAIIIAILATIFLFIPTVGFVIITIVSILYYVPLVFCIIGIIYAATEKQKELPIIGKFGTKLKI